jgi:hypothetical protein
VWIALFWVFCKFFHNINVDNSKYLVLRLLPDNSMQHKSFLYSYLSLASWNWTLLNVFNIKCIFEGRSEFFSSILYSCKNSLSRKSIPIFSLEKNFSFKAFAVLKMCMEHFQLFSSACEMYEWGKNSSSMKILVLFHSVVHQHSTLLDA